jgi:hypothetical protein
MREGDSGERGDSECADERRKRNAVIRWVGDAVRGGIAHKKGLHLVCCAGVREMAQAECG